MHPEDLNVLADTLRGIIDEATKESEARYQQKLELLKVEFEKRLQEIPAGKDGRDGKDGKDGESIVGPQGPQGERGERGERGEHGDSGPAGKDGERGERGERGQSGEKGETGEVGPAGRDGERGQSGERGPVGASGRDGRDVTPSEVNAIVEEVSERHFDRIGLDVERRIQDRVQRAIDSMPKPKDGRDALEIEDISITDDGDGNVSVLFKRGKLHKEFFLRFPRFKDQGVFKEGTEYQAGDGVSFAGSYFIAQKDAPEGKPEGGKDWRLAVKRGRDGRDGVMKPEPGGPVKL